MKKIKGLVLVLLLGILTGCSKQPVEETEIPVLEDNEMFVFFVNADRTDVYPVPYVVEQKNNVSTLVSEVIRFMTDATATAEYQPPIPKEITFLNSEYDDTQNTVKVAFDVFYEDIDAEEMIFFKTCVAWTLLQLEEVESVSISLTDLANEDVETATTVETVDRDSFTMNFGDRQGYKQTGTIVLYFANEDGTALKEAQHTVEISNTTSLARLVVEALISGPEEAGYQETFSDETKINNISVNNGICYVDLSDEFYDTANPLRNDIIVYSVVNSLVELPTVTKVQFLKNGEKLAFFRETLPFDGIFERNLDIVEREAKE